MFGRLGNWLKRLLAAVVAPAAFLAASAYFLWSATQGERGLQAYAISERELDAAREQLRAAEADLAMWTRRVSNLRDKGLDKDALDERARATLNLADPDDIIVLYGSRNRLY